MGSMEIKLLPDPIGGVTAHNAKLARTFINSLASFAQPTAGCCRLRAQAHSALAAGA